ncbi:alpha/beta hydrolase [Rhodococcus sp. GOMB7]|nr:alpha/beta hydrolase [Rhodococcus sp. GOMB7]
MSYLHVDDQKIWYTDTGRGSVPIIFLHGFLMDGTMFDQQVNTLGADFRCITVDSRCHGQTEESGHDFTLWDLANDAIAVLDHLGISKATVVGMSQGGMVAQRVALANPERVSALVLIGTEARGMTDESRQLRLRRDAAWAAEGAEGFAPQIASVVFGDPDLEAEWIPKWIAWDKARLPQASRALSFRDSLVDRLAEIACPVLQIHGREDKAIELTWAMELRDGLRDVTFIAIDGAHHSPNMTHPIEVNRAILNFMAEIAETKT